MVVCGLILLGGGGLGYQNSNKHLCYIWKFIYPCWLREANRVAINSTGCITYSISQSTKRAIMRSINYVWVTSTPIISHKCTLHIFQEIFFVDVEDNIFLHYKKVHIRTNSKVASSQGQIYACFLKNKSATDQQRDSFMSHYKEDRSFASYPLKEVDLNVIAAQYGLIFL